MTLLYIPAYTIEDIATFCPYGTWQLVSVNDHSNVLATLFNASFVTYTSSLSTHTQLHTVGATDDPTVLLAG